ncbi:ANTAR domain-containing protein [Curtobacterium sp. 9128]|uniref:ANTAR domain-containing protein n=1 Tax=Curtobacterium sp. 9128 TaxID=1793722 RepID=UPI0011A9C691|nr:ANTAR domain-containing protein [Curtobacterium sp. 9128]
MSNDDFVTAIAALYGAADDDDLCAPFLLALPVTGAAITTLSTPFAPEIVCASDPVATRLADIQIDLGEGPAWEAMRTQRPVSEPDVQTATSERWPIALLAMSEIEVGSVFAFPLRVGTFWIGSVDLYDTTAGPLAARTVQDAIALTDAAAGQVLRRALDSADERNDGRTDIGHQSRREVYQASGMIAAQTGVGATDALLLLRAYAFTDGRSVRDLAHEVIAGTVDFTDRTDTAP